MQEIDVEDAVGTDNCARCGGLGWVVVDDGQAGAAEPCTCRTKVLLAESLAAAGVPGRHRRCSFDSFDPSGHASLLEAKTLAQRYVERFVRRDGSFTDTGLLFWGPPGTGKTHLAVAILQDLVKRYRVRAHFADFASLIHSIQATFGNDSGSNRGDVLSPALNAELLVLDEIGAQKPRAWTLEQLDLLINTRYNARLPTIFTSNYALPSSNQEGRAESSESLDREPSPQNDQGQTTLASRIPQRLLSRLFEMVRPIQMWSEDYRREVAGQKAANSLK